MTLTVDLNDLHARRILVAGGAGFVGSALCRQLLGHGAQICIFDNLLHGSADNVEGLGIELIQGDACDPDALAACMRSFEPELVVNSIGDTFVTTAYRDTLRFLQNNVEATHNLLRSAVRGGVHRILHLSSTEVYDAAGAGALDESAALSPVNSYAVTKLAADRLCATMSIESGVPVVIARLFNCYGPRETHAYVIPEIIQQLHEGNRIHLGALHAARDFTFVDDTARALCALLVADTAPGTVFNVGSGRAYTVEELVATLARIMRPEGITLASDERRLRVCEIDRFLCDNRRLHQLTGWQPEFFLADGLKKTVEWFEQNGHRWPWKHAHIERVRDDAVVGVGESRAARARLEPPHCC